MTDLQTKSPLREECQQGDRRRVSRVQEAQGETVLVSIAGLPPQTAVFIDESPLGIGIALREHIPLQIGQDVEVVFRGTAQSGVVSSVKSYSDVLRVGLAWKDLVDEPFPRI